jgi:hypothetical protein
MDARRYKLRSDSTLSLLEKEQLVNIKRNQHMKTLTNSSWRFEEPLNQLKVARLSFKTKETGGNALQ